jgi:hypothetical protein
MDDPPEAELHMPDVGSREWTDLCEWFVAKATIAIQKAGDKKTEEHVTCILAAFLRETPPKSAETIEMWRKVAEIHVSEWDDGRFSLIDEFPLDPSLDRILGNLPASTNTNELSRNP